MESNVSRPDFQILFESLPGLYLVLTPDLTIVAASDSYLAATLTQRSQIVGRALFEVFPDNPDDPGATGVMHLRASLDRVLATKSLDRMAIQKYDIRKPDSTGGEFEERYWRPLNSPVLGADGEVRYILHRVEDVTDMIRLEKVEQEQAGTLERIRHDERLLDQIFNESPSFMTVTLGPNHRYNRANQTYYETFNLDSSIIGHTVREIFPEIESQGFIRLLDEVYRTGKPVRFENAEVKVNKGIDGSERTFYFAFAYQPIRGPDGEVYGLIHQGYDVTESVLSRRSMERAKALIENERENFRNLFKETPELVCITRGPEHVFEFVNEAHIRVLGFNATGKALREAQPESVEVHGLLDDVYRTGRTIELRELPVTVTGRLRYFNVTYAARRDEIGEINGVMILGIEVTDQVVSRERLKKSERELRESEEAFRETFRLASVGIALLSPDGHWLKINPALCEITGYSESELRQKTFADITHPDDVQRDWDLAKKVLSGEISSYSMEKRYIRKDGRAIWVSLTVSLKRKSDGTPDYFIGCIDDITLKKRSSEELEREVQLRTSQLRTAIAELESFSHSVSHDLRAPLRSINGFSQRILKRSAHLDADAKSDLERIRAASVRMGRLIDDLLSLSRVSRAEVRFRKVNLSALAQDVVNELRSGDSDRNNIEIRIEPGIFARGDEGLLRQVLQNLIGNAWKFTRKTPHALIEIGGVTHDSDTIVTVRDNGAGFDMAYSEKLFGAFQRLHAETEFEGTGIGLATVRRILNKHGGDIWASGEVGRGASFSFRLPAEKDREISPPPQRDKTV